jgi:hypothetical protein
MRPYPVMYAGRNCYTWLQLHSARVAHRWYSREDWDGTTAFTTSRRITRAAVKTLLIAGALWLAVLMAQGVYSMVVLSRPNAQPSVVICVDGWTSSSSGGPGTCSHHGGMQ